MTDDEYRLFIEHITEDSTFVFFWLGCCKGKSLNTWTSSEHHYHLEVWCYNPVVYWQAKSWLGNWGSLYWRYEHGGDFPETHSEGKLFFDNWHATYPMPLTILGNSINYYFNEHNSGDMYTISYWGSHHFYIW